MKKSKVMALTLAGAVAVTTLLAGTYAWKSVNQKVKNQVRQTVNPGARLHDDFNFTSKGNKDVYVENFTKSAESGVPIYARIRLDEYMEIGAGAGLAQTEGKTATSIVSGATFDNPDSWTTYKWEREKLIEDGANEPTIHEETSPFRKYILWNQKGAANQTYYLPTFNKNKDSDAADINGTLEGIGGVPYADNVVYESGQSVTDIAVYDADDDTEDELAEIDLDEILAEITETSGKDRTWNKTQLTTGNGGSAMEQVSVGGKTYPIKVNVNDSGDITSVEMDLDSDTGNDGYDIELKQETHETKKTLEGGKIMSMAEWKKQGSKAGNYWVYDTDGWVYWANQLKAEEITSLLLDKIELRSEAVLEDEYYYAINVVGQFCTNDGQGTWTDFTTGGTLSDDAKQLLNTISNNAWEKYTVQVTKFGGEETTAEVAQEGNVKLSAAVKNGEENATPNITWTVKRADGKSVATGTKLSSVGNNTKDIILTVGVGEEAGTDALVVTATHKDTKGCYGAGEIKITVTESAQIEALRREIATKAENVTTGTYKADDTVKVRIDEQDWYIIAKDDDANPTKALLYAASSLDYDGTATYKWTDGFGSDNKWINSNIRKYLNGSFIEGNTAYQGNTFGDKYEYAFALAEPTTIYTRTSVDSISGSGMEDFTPTDDKVFLLSEADLYASFLGRYQNSTDGYLRPGVQAYDYTVRKTQDGVETGVRLWGDATNDQRKDTTNGGQGSWLRSPIHYGDNVAEVYTNGDLVNVNCSNAVGALRPAFWVDISSVEPNE